MVLVGGGNEGGALVASHLRNIGGGYCGFHDRRGWYIVSEPPSVLDNARLDRSLISIALILHDISATALLLLISWQTLIAWSSTAGASSVRFETSFSSFGLRGLISALFVSTIVLGGILYPAYRLFVRPNLVASGMRYANGAFEIKEQLAALCLVMLPVYYASWRSGDIISSPIARRVITSLLCAMVWWNFIIGHFMNFTKSL
jgi:hypothetical protein